MSAYLQMWAKINEMDEGQRDRWLASLVPAKGNDVDFDGVHVLDVDLIEALRNAK